MSPRRTRLAPSPTGALHLGNARTFALTWALARNEGWEIVLRMEDLDRERMRPGAIDATARVLAWLGLDFDGAMRVQSDDLEPYRTAMRQLATASPVTSALFRCDRSRADVRRAASAPHAADGETRYEPFLRPPREAFVFTDDTANHRLLVEPGLEVVHDELLGDLSFDPGSEVGDFLIWTRLGVPSYQLAVVVDDLRHGITDVVRGVDLLSSTARQQLLRRRLSASDSAAHHAAMPRWWHLPLVHDAAGRRLAKRDDDLGLERLAQRGVRRERVLGLLAAWSGFLPRPRLVDSADFRSFVAPDTLRSMARRESEGAPCTVTEEDVRWLLES